MSNYRKHLTITITGETESDLCSALDEVSRKVEDCYLSGFGSNETGDYEFSVSDDLNQPLAPAQAGE